MRLAFASWLALTSPALAWEFTPGFPCVLTHEAHGVSVKLTHDPTKPLYTLALTKEAGFEADAQFAMLFEGAMPIRIATDRHQLSADGKTLSVADSGFGNVLNGLQFNAIATATLGAQTVQISLTGAAAPVAAFRACEGIVPVV